MGTHAGITCATSLGSLLVNRRALSIRTTFLLLVGRLAVLSGRLLLLLLLGIDRHVLSARSHGSHAASLPRPGTGTGTAGTGTRLV
jgi:hypothetical protein